MIDKPGRLLDPEDLLLVLEDSNPYVSRGGLKLEHALDTFDINPSGLTALDVGASTGGFTDCLLQRDVQKVVAIDVGYGQLDWKIRQDKRVTVIERKNARELEQADVDNESFDLAVIDVSFISLCLILPRVVSLMKETGSVVAMVKPQFEVGKAEVENKGVIRDPTKQYGAVVRVAACMEELRWGLKNVTPSPITGQKGNREFFLHCCREAYGTLWEPGDLWSRIHPDGPVLE